MHVLHILDSLAPHSGGPARSVPQLALSQAELGLKVSLWSPQPFLGALADLSIQENQKLARFSGDFSTALQAVGQVDILHAHGIWQRHHHTVAQDGSRKSIPRIVSPRGMLEPWAINHKKLKKKIAWHLYQKRDLQSADGLHATAQSEAIQLRKLGLTPPILEAANGVDVPATFNPTDATQTDTKTALFLSRIHPKKGLPLLIEAWSRVLPEDWKMIVVGPNEGGHLEEVRQLVTASGLEPNWEFTSPVEGAKKWGALAKADLFILPSYSENFGMVVAEALAVGTPVITTTGTPWEGLHEHRCGWWVEPTVKGLADALMEATLISSCERQSMGDRGKSWVKRDFSWPTTAKQTIDFYEEIVAGKKLKKL